jgi:hypothetical protein
MCRAWKAGQKTDWNALRDETTCWHLLHLGLDEEIISSGKYLQRSLSFNAFICMKCISRNHKLIIIILI